MSLCPKVLSPREGVVYVVDVAPFWRYAVGPSSEHSPAIPFYRRVSAKGFFEEAKRTLPWSGVVLYKRRGIGRVEVVEEYEPIHG